MKVLSVFAVIFLVSCAQKQILLSGKSRPYSSASTVTPIVTGTKNIKIMDVVDNRSNSAVGVARTGVQYAETPILMQQNIPEFIKQFFTSAFYKRNIMVQDNATISFKIIVNKMWLTEVLNNNEAAKCEVDFSFEALEGKRSWKGNVLSEYRSKGDLSDGTDKLGPTLATCLNNVVEKLVVDDAFVTFIKK